MAIDSFEIISVPVSDQQRAKAFYRDVLGFSLVREEPMGPDMSWVQLAPPGQSVTIALVKALEKMKPGGLQGVMVNTADIAAEHAVLRQRGLAIGDIQQQPWGRFALFSDPDGNGWILREPPAAQKPG